MAWVLENGPASPMQRLVLLALANRAGPDGSGARPGLERLCRETALGRRAVLRILAELHADGWIVRTRRAAKDRPTCWQIALAQRVPNGAPVTEPTGARTDRNGCTDLRERVHEIAPTGARPSASNRHEPSKNRPEPKSSRTPTDRQLVRPELVPMPAPVGAGGELAIGQRLDALIEAVRRNRDQTLPLSRRQATAARRIARDRLEAGTDPRLIVLGLVAASAFTDAAVDFAIDRLRREAVGAGRSRLSKFEQSELR